VLPHLIYSSKILKLTIPLISQGLVTSGEGVGVGVFVGVGVGVYPVIITSIRNPPQGFDVVGVGVGVGVGVFVGVGVGVWETKQLKIALKSKESHADVVVVVVVGHNPLKKNPESKSGKVEPTPDGPNWSQVPPKLKDKHQESSVNE
jgi:hypothetical protein